MKNRLVLASGSPRRIEMFQGAGLEPVIRKSEIEERLPEECSPAVAVMYLALSKALSVEGEGETGIIVGADTVVYKDRILGKPSDFNEAMDMLESLRGKTHQVLTGVALLEAGTENRRVFYETTEVHFLDYTREEMEAYVRSGEPFDKAGGYAIQGGWGRYIDYIVGDYDNVIGFPWKRAMEELDRMGFAKAE